MWLTRRRDLLLFFCLRGGSEYRDIFSEIALLDKIFKVLAERPTLRSSVSFVVVERTIVSHFGANSIIRVCLWTLHPGLTFDGFEDVLDQEPQQVEAVRYLVSSGLAGADADAS